MARFYRRFVKAGDVCFDIGANVGERSGYLLNLGAHVVSVEPQKSCFVMLEAKFKNETRIRLVNSAVGAEKGQMDLRICDETNQCATLSHEFIAVFSTVSDLHWGKSEQVEVTTLDELVCTFGMPKLCKIDVEGFESEVFKGMSNPIPVLCFEFNYPFLKDTEKCLALLEMKGNYSCNFVSFEYMELILDEWVPVADFRKNLTSYIPAVHLTGEIVLRLELAEQV
jgi:FkbM family methyltransferase